MFLCINAFCQTEDIQPQYLRYIVSTLCTRESNLIASDVWKKSIDNWSLRLPISLVIPHLLSDYGEAKRKGYDFNSLYMFVFLRMFLRSLKLFIRFWWIWCQSIRYYDSGNIGYILIYLNNKRSRFYLVNPDFNRFYSFFIAWLP